MQIRAEQEVDIPSIRDVVTVAFGQPGEAVLIDALRSSGDLQYSLVAEYQNAEGIGRKIVGHIGLSVLSAPKKALALAPVSVVPAEQQKGIGSGLINHALGLARKDGFDIVFVLGNPAYYAKFGFSVETASLFSSLYSGPYFMAQYLCNSSIAAAKVIYPSAFDDLE